MTSHLHRTSDTAPDRTLLLLDIDGVLVYPRGYKEALRAMVAHFSTAMGLVISGPDDHEIAVFEACGLTNEWDSGAMCVSALLMAALAQRPDLFRATLDATFAAIREAGIGVPRPDFAGEARAIARQPHSDSLRPSTIYMNLLAAQADPAHLPLLDALLGDVYAARDNTITRVFQTYVLGSDRYASTYDRAAPFESDSMLMQYDRPLLHDDLRARLVAWSQEAAHGMTIYTARPSQPPADLPPGTPTGDPPAGYPPEAELAAELLALHGVVPLIGQGRVGWLAWRNGRSPSDYVKPSPVQALAAIGAAMSHGETDALHAAAELVEHGHLTGPLAALRGSRTRVIVCEDAAGGLRAGHGAVERLAQVGLDVQFEGIGVSPHADKRAALEAIADRVVDDIDAALEPLLNGL